MWWVSDASGRGDESASPLLRHCVDIAWKDRRKRTKPVDVYMGFEPATSEMEVRKFKELGLTIDVVLCFCAGLYV
jgi:hypothetical protein